MQATEDFKVILKLTKMIFFLIIYLHLTGCFWLLIAVLNDGVGEFSHNT